MLLVFIAAGCATTKATTSHDQVQMRVAELEKNLEEKDMEIVDLKYEIKELESRVGEEASVPSAVEEFGSDDVDSKYTAIHAEVIRVSASPKDIQRALKNAGVYSGNVDGKVGPQTRKAIENFQMSNNLKPDGVVGKKTWEALQKYLD